MEPKTHVLGTGFLFLLRFCKNHDIKNQQFQGLNQVNVLYPVLKKQKDIKLYIIIHRIGKFKKKHVHPKIRNSAPPQEKSPTFFARFLTKPMLSRITCKSVRLGLRDSAPQVWVFFVIRGKDVWCSNKGERPVNWERFGCRFVEGFVFYCRFVVVVSVGL